MLQEAEFRVTALWGLGLSRSRALEENHLEKGLGLLGCFRISSSARSCADVGWEATAWLLEEDRDRGIFNPQHPIP